MTLATMLRAIPACVLAFGVATSASATVLTATTTTSVEPTGAYDTNDTYFNIRGPAKTFPQFGLVDFTGFGALTPTSNTATLTITDSPYGSTVPGTIDFYLASSTATPLSSLSFDTSAAGTNPTGVGPATGFATGSVFDKVGSAAYTSTSASPDGAPLTFNLNFTSAAPLYASELAAGDLRLLITVDASTPGAEPTFYGAGSSFSPTLTIATAASGGGTPVPEPATLACLGAAALLIGAFRRRV